MKQESRKDKSMLISMFVAAFFACSMSSCNDDISDAMCSAPQTESHELQNLEQYSYTVPVKVNAQGDWKIDIKFADAENHFCYALPDHGHGPATVKLCMLDNWTNERNNAELTIVDLSNGQNMQAMRISQKCNLDNPQFTAGRRAAADGVQPGVNYNQGDIVYGVGYGYDATCAPGSDAIARNPIIALEKLAAAGYDYGAKFSNTSANISASTFSASRISEVCRKMETSCNIKGTYAGFTAEAGASYTASQKQNNSCNYVMRTVDVAVRNAYLQGVDLDNVRDFMTDNAKRAIDGTGKSYPSTKAGFKKLIENYGSHLIVKTMLGGRLRYASTVSTSLTSNSDEAKVYANLSYKNKVLETAEAKASAEQQRKFEENNSAVQTNVSAVGGSFAACAALYGAGNDSDANVNGWIQSLGSNENLAVVGFGKSKVELWPLYELVDDSTPEGEARKVALKEYMETGLMADESIENYDVYTQNDIAQLNLSTWWETNVNGKSANVKGTLIHEVWSDNKVIAWVCAEYIPQISNQGMVAVVYPVKDGRANFQAGFFLGAPDYASCNVSWQSNGKCEFSKRSENKGMVKAICFRGGEIFPASSNTLNIGGSTIKTATATPKYLNGQCYTKDPSYPYAVIFGYCDHQFTGIFGVSEIYEHDDTGLLSLHVKDMKYDLVKIGTRVWTRSDWQGPISCGADRRDRYGSVVANGNNVYATKQAVQVSKPCLPKGWRFANSNDFQNLKNVVNVDGHYDINRIARPFNFSTKKFPSGYSLTGFDMEWNGWYTYTHRTITKWYVNSDTEISGEQHYYYDYSLNRYCEPHMEYMTADGMHVRITNNGAFDIVNENSNWAMCTRIVME